MRSRCHYLDSAFGTDLICMRCEILLEVPFHKTQPYSTTGFMAEVDNGISPLPTRHGTIQHLAVASNVLYLCEGSTDALSAELVRHKITHTQGHVSPRAAIPFGMNAGVHMPGPLSRSLARLQAL